VAVERAVPPPDGNVNDPGYREKASKMVKALTEDREACRKNPDPEPIIKARQAQL
jgi:hypothetical protein